MNEEDDNRMTQHEPEDTAECHWKPDYSQRKEPQATHNVPRVRRRQVTATSRVTTTVVYGVPDPVDTRHTVTTTGNQSTKDRLWDHQIDSAPTDDIAEQHRRSRHLSPFAIAGATSAQRCWNCSQVSDKLVLQCSWCYEDLNAMQHAAVPVTANRSSFSGVSRGAHSHTHAARHHIVV